MTNNKTLLDEFLSQVSDPKTRETTRAILEQRPDVDPVYKQINNLFISFVNASIIADTEGSHVRKWATHSDTAYNTLIKLLYTQAVIFNSDMLPVICLMFIYHCGKELKLKSTTVKPKDCRWPALYSGDADTDKINNLFNKFLSIMANFRRKHLWTFEPRKKGKKVSYSIGGDKEIVRAVNAVALLRDNPCKITVINPDDRLNQYYQFTLPGGRSKHGIQKKDPTCYINYNGVLYPKEKMVSK